MKPDNQEVMHPFGSDLFPRESGSGNSTCRCFSVEARMDFPDPKIVNGQLFDGKWRQIEFATAAVGVPNHLLGGENAKTMGRLSWSAANALRWWFHSQAGFSSYCLQTRIVEYEYKESFTSTIVGFHDVIGGGGSDDISRLAHSPPAKARTDQVPLWREQMKK